MFRQCCATSRGTPVMSAGHRANMSLLLDSNSFNCTRVAGEMACPNRMVCSGYSSFRTYLSGSFDVEGLATFVGGSSSTYMTSLLEYRIATPVSVGNPHAACGIEVIMLNSLCDLFPSKTSWRDVAGITMKFTVTVRECSPSERVTGNAICPNGKTASLQKPVRGKSTGSRRALSSGSSCLKHCS